MTPSNQTLEPAPRALGHTVAKSEHLHFQRRGSALTLGGEEHEHQRATFAVSRTEIG